MSSEVVSVIAASAQSVAKVFLIGAVGYGSVIFPRRSPLLPRESVSVVARFGFHVFVLSLIYSTTAVSVSIESMSQYWFVVVAAFFVLGTSYATATILGKWTPGLRISNPQDFAALRIAATFPNIVALPILVFPSLCEYPVVHENFASQSIDSSSDAPQSSNQLEEQCTDEATAMIFCYFFSWSLMFWSVGYPQLMAAAHARASLAHQPTGHNPSDEEDDDDDDKNANDAEVDSESPLKSLEEGEDALAPESRDTTGPATETRRQSPTIETTNAAVPTTLPTLNTPSAGAPAPPTSPFLCNILKALRQTCCAPGFIALALGTITGCIPPLRDALFETGGFLRFMGDAIQTLARASAPVSTMVVAASLVPPGWSSSGGAEGEGATHQSDCRKIPVGNNGQASENLELPAENPIMSDPDFGPHQPRRRRRSSLYRLGSSLRQSSASFFNQVKQQQSRTSPEQRRLLVWFILSRLVVTPALVFGSLLGLEHWNALDGVPPLSKLVVLVNAVLPGALIVVVLLKAQPGLADSASAVARVYLPSYLLSILTIASWTALGLWIAMPRGDGTV